MSTDPDAAGQSEATCALCEGRGWVVSDDGGAGAARPCVCRQAEAVPQLLAAAGIPARYEGCRLSNFRVDFPGSGDALRAAQAVSQRYVDGFLGLEGMRQSGLLFVGPPGVGKTHLAVAVLVEVVRRFRVQGRFVDFTSLLHQIQATFSPGASESKHEILEPVMGAELLLVDELGAQKASPWVNDILYLILNARYTRRLPTLFTTNYHLEEADEENLDQPRLAGAGELKSRIPASLVSRLYEMAQPVVIDSFDFRRVVKMHQHTV